MVGVEPLADDHWPVLLPNLQACAADVTDVVVLRWVEFDMEDVTLLDAGAPAAEAANHLVIGYVDQDRHGDRAAEVGHLRVERFGLRGGPGETVEDEPVP